MTFAQSWLLGFLLVYWVAEAVYFYRIRTESTPLPQASFLKPRRTWRGIASRLARPILAAAVSLMLVALARPETTEVRKYILPSGIDIVVALDVSGSMAAEDFQPLNRLAVAKDVLRDFIEGRPSDRIGLLLFAGRPLTRSPLTLQHAPLQSTLQSVDLGALPEGTAIGSAILSGVNRLSDAGKNAKGDRILLLITDGRNNAGEVHPLDALDIAVQQRIRIYTVGVGSRGEVPFPLYGPDGKKTYRYEKADLDEELLQTIAERTGGKYFRATDPKSMAGLFAQINKLEKSESRSIESRAIQSRAWLFLAPAALLALCYVLLTIFIIRYP